MTVVVDASLLGAALVSSAAVGVWAESVVAGHDLAAPELVLVETSNVLRRLEPSGAISTLEANSAQRDLQRPYLRIHNAGRRLVGRSPCHYPFAGEHCRAR